MEEDESGQAHCTICDFHDFSLTKEDMKEKRRKRKKMQKKKDTKEKRRERKMGGNQLHKSRPNA